MFLIQRMAVSRKNRDNIKELSLFVVSLDGKESIS